MQMSASPTSVDDSFCCDARHLMDTGGFFIATFEKRADLACGASGVKGFVIRPD